MRKLIGSGLLSWHGRIGKMPFLVVVLMSLLVWFLIYCLIGVLGFYSLNQMFNPLMLFVFYPANILWQLLLFLSVLFQGPASTLVFLNNSDHLAPLIVAFVFLVVVCPILIPAIIKRSHDRDRSGVSFVGWLIANVLALFGAASIFGTGLTYNGTSFLYALDAHQHGRLFLVCMGVYIVSLAFLIIQTIELIFFDGKRGPNQYGADPLSKN